MLDNYIHLVTPEDTLVFRGFCKPNSHFFSNSDAFINSYLNIGSLAFCYNDSKTIFFFRKFIDRNFYFFCCPKGVDWQKKMFAVIFQEKKELSGHFKKIRLWELPCALSDIYLQDKRFKSIKPTVQKRYILYLPDYKDLKHFLSKDRVLRGKWNGFFNSLYRKEGDKQIFCKILSKDTYQDAIKILNHWRSYKNKRDSHSNSLRNNLLIDRELIFKKDIRVIEDALKRPNLYESLILYCNGYPRGIEIAFKIEKSQNLSSSVTCIDRKIPCMGEVLLFLFFEMMAKKSYQQFNWGNSYLPSIEKFKRKFHPTKYEHSYEYFIEFKN